MHQLCVVYILSHVYVLYRSNENLSDRPVKKINLRFQGSSVGTQKQIVQDVRKGKKQLFNEEIRAQPSDEVSQKMMVVATGGRTFLTVI